MPDAFASTADAESPASGGWPMPEPSAIDDEAAAINGVESAAASTVPELAAATVPECPDSVSRFSRCRSVRSSADLLAQTPILLQSLKDDVLKLRRQIAVEPNRRRGNRVEDCLEDDS